MSGPVTSWSFSRYNLYKMCPLKFKLSVIDKIKEPPNEAMDRGDRVHKDAEKYIKGLIPRITPELKSFSDMFKRLRTQYKDSVLYRPIVEETWAFRSDWSSTVWNDWNGCWLRIKVDCAEFTDKKSLLISDWKTGKFRTYNIGEYEEQQELYALGGLAKFPDSHVEEVRTRLVYVDEAKVHPDNGHAVYTRDQLEGLKKKWEKKVVKLFKDKSFKPTPNDKCQWCHYRASNKANGGGQCKY